MTIEEAYADFGSLETNIGYLNYFDSSMMEHYKLDNYDPTQGYQREPPRPVVTEKPKSKLRLFGK